MIPVPENERSPLLQPILRECVEATQLLFKNQHQLGILPNDIFANAMSQWFLADDLTEQQLNEVTVRQKQLLEVGFNGEDLKKKLEALFVSDPHLASCCKGVWMLTKCLSSLFLNFLGSNVPIESFDLAYSRFSNYLYCDRYRVYMVHHLFNFEADIDRFEIAGTVIGRFTKGDLVSVFENEVVFDLFHAEDVGAFFAIREIPGDERNLEEFLKSHKLTYDSINDTIGILQFIKDGLVFSDYSFLSYQPHWVNKLFPPLPVGNQRKIPYDQGKSFYQFSLDDVARAQKWLRIWASPEIQSRLEKRSNLGNLVRLAIEFYTSSFYQLDEAQRLLHLTFALEALFSPNQNQELSFRIRQYASQFVGGSAKERKDIFALVKKAYERRSKLVHGLLDVTAYIDDTLTTASSNIELASVVRRAILGMLAMLFRGRDNLKDQNKSDCIHRELELAALNRGTAYRLRKESNPEDFVNSFVQ